MPSAKKEIPRPLEAMIGPSYDLGLLGCIVYLKFRNSFLRIYPSAPGLTIRAERGRMRRFRVEGEGEVGTICVFSHPPGHLFPRPTDRSLSSGMIQTRAMVGQ